MGQITLDLTPNKEKLKVDFGYYPYKRLRKGQSVDGVNIDSLFDIAVNKLQTIHQRSDVIVSTQIFPNYH